MDDKKIVCAKCKNEFDVWDMKYIPVEIGRRLLFFKKYDWFAVCTKCKKELIKSKDGKSKTD